MEPMGRFKPLGVGFQGLGFRIQVAASPFHATNTAALQHTTPDRPSAKRKL